MAQYYGLISKIKLQQLLNDEALSNEDVEALWNEQHKDGAQKLAETISDLKGFYVKTAQIISARQDLFPKEYTKALSGFTDNLDPMPVELAKAVVCTELLKPNERFEDVFAEFDDIPLGAASVAQVHRAVLTEAYGGPREVAVKIQRPSIESKLMGDIANLKTISKAFRNNPNLPLDYYTVFSELETQLQEEFDFVAEAVAMDRIYQSLIRDPITGEARDMPLVVPRPVNGMVSKRVLVMDFLRGVPLSRAREEMERRGVDPESPEAKLFGRNLLTALTTVFGRNILETGFFHADPHPGNIFVLDDGKIGLIDFGQVKQISGRLRQTLAEVMVALDERQDGVAEDNELVGKLALDLGVELRPEAKPEAAAAVGIWLFDGSVKTLPGGYDEGELSPNSPVKELKSFPQDLVLVGRSSILIKGLSNHLGIPWSLAKEWADTARKVLHTPAQTTDGTTSTDRTRFKVVASTFKQWIKGRADATIRKLPSPLKSRVAKVLLKIQERRTRRKLMRRSKK